MSDEIKLANGQSLKGKVISEDDHEYMIEMSIGTMRINKADVISITQNEKNEKNTDDQKLRFEICKSIDDFLKLAEQATDMKDHVMLGKAVRKIETMLKNKPNQEFEQQLFSMINKASKNCLDEANDLFQQGLPRKSVLKINEILDNLKSLSWQSTLKALKKKCYDVMLSESESMESCQEAIDAFTLYETQESDVSSRHRPKPASKTKSGKQSKKSAPANLSNSHEKWIPELTPVISQILELSNWKKYIEDNEWHTWSGRSVHSVDALNKSRGNQASFNQLRSENNQIYNARRVCNQFNRNVLNLRNAWLQLKSKIEYQEQYMSKQGYEKINGEWLSGDDMKTAKGWVNYRGKWLDPTATDFNLEKSKLDEQATILFQNKKLDEAVQEEEPMDQDAFKKKAVKSEKSQSDSQGEFDIDAMVLSGSSNYLVKHVSDTISSEAKDYVHDTVEDVKNQIDQAKPKLSEFEEKSGGLSTAKGIVLIFSILTFIFFYKRSKF